MNRETYVFSLVIIEGLPGMTYMTLPSDKKRKKNALNLIGSSCQLSERKTIHNNHIMVYGMFQEMINEKYMFCYFSTCSLSY